MKWPGRLALSVLLVGFVLAMGALGGLRAEYQRRLATAEVQCRDGEVMVYNLRQHKDPVFGWVPDQEEQHQGVVPMQWCDSTGIPQTFTADERDAYGVSLERP